MKRVSARNSGGRSASRSRAGTACIAAIVLAMLPPLARAQRLNLDDTPAPAPGSGLAALALADEVEKEAAELMKGSPTALDRARVAVRCLARDLIRSGEQAGGAGSVRVLAGRTIAMRRSALDECLRAQGVDGAMLEALVRDLSLPAKDLPADPGGLDRLLRDAWSSVAQHVTIAFPAGWVGAEAPGQAGENPRALGEVARRNGISREGIAAFEELEARLALAEGWTVYRARARATRTLIERAAGAWALEKAEGLGDAALARLRKDLVEAVAELARGGESAEPLGTLRRLAAFVGAVGAAQELDSGRAARAVRAALGEVVASPSWTGDPGLPTRLSALERAIRTVLDAPGAGDKAVVRQLRPALRALEPAARQSAAQLMETMPRLLKQADALSDPAVLGAITAHEHRLADLAIIRELSAAVAEPGGSGEVVARGAMKPLADRLLILGQDLGKPETRDVALTELREAASQLADYRQMPGEKELRAGLQAGDPEWAAVAERTGDLPAAIDQARAAWLAERTAPKGIPTAQKAHRLAVLRAGLRVVADSAGARRVIERADGGALNAWPGWELSREALAVITGGLFDQTSRLVGELLTGRDDEAEASMARIGAQNGAALLLGRLTWRAEELGLRPQASASAGALAQVALGPPDPEGAWLAGVETDLRGELAAVCRYAEESAFAQAKKENAAAQQFRAYYNARARVALDRLEAQPRR